MKRRVAREEITIGPGQLACFEPAVNIGIGINILAFIIQKEDLALDERGAHSQPFMTTI